MNRVFYHSFKNFMRLVAWTLFFAVIAYIIPIATDWTDEHWGSALYGLIPIPVLVLSLISYNLGKTDAWLEEHRNRQVYDALRKD